MFAEGTRDCSIEACWFDAVGGNAIFVNNHNRRFSVSGCKFTESGDSAICFVGDLEKTVGTQRAFPLRMPGEQQSDSRLRVLRQADRRGIHLTGQTNYRQPQPNV